MGAAGHVRCVNEWKRQCKRELINSVHADTRLQTRVESVCKRRDVISRSLDGMHAVLHTTQTHIRRVDGSITNHLFVKRKKSIYSG